jgi:hypothetical protein
VCLIAPKSRDTMYYVFCNSCISLLLCNRYLCCSMAHCLGTQKLSLRKEQVSFKTWAPFLNRLYNNMVLNHTCIILYWYKVILVIDKLYKLIWFFFFCLTCKCPKFKLWVLGHASFFSIGHFGFWDGKVK